MDQDNRTGAKVFIAIGVSKYADVGTKALVNVPRVVDDIASTFETMGYQRTLPIKLDPKRSDVAPLERFCRSPDASRREAALVLYIACHGTVSDAEHWLMMSDWDKANQSSTGLQTRALGTWLAHAGFRAVLLVLDTCYAGSAVPNIASSFLSVLPGHADIRMAVIATARPSEEAYEGRFVEALSAVLSSTDSTRKCGGPEVEFLSLDGLVALVNAKLVDAGHQARLLTLADDVLPFFPNPSYRKEVPAAYLLADQPVKSSGVSAPAPTGGAPPRSSDADLERFEAWLDSLDDRNGQVLDVLTALAFAQGAGLPFDDILPRVASAVAQCDITDHAVDYALRQAAAYVRVEVVAGRALYRLSHELYAQQLRSRQDQAAAHKRIAAALEQISGDTLEPAMSHPYVRRYLDAHLAASLLVIPAASTPNDPMVPSHAPAALSGFAGFVAGSGIAAAMLVSGVGGVCVAPSESSASLQQAPMQVHSEPLKPLLGAPAAPVPTPPVEPLSAPAAKPVTATVRFRATDLANGPEIASGLTWVVEPQFDSPEVKRSNIGAFDVQLALGRYQVTVVRSSDGLQATSSIEVGPDSPRRITIALESQQSAKVQGPARVPEGSTFQFTWSGPKRKTDRVALVPASSDDRKYIQELSVSADSATPATLRAPADPGVYELRYLLHGVEVLARSKITIGPELAGVKVPASVEAGSEFQFSWTGPNHKSDRLEMVPVGTEDGRYFLDLTVAADRSSPATLRAPAKPGEYEIRYALDANVNARSTILARARFSVTPAVASVKAPASVQAGAEFQFSWTGPDHEVDQVQFVSSNMADGRYYPDLTVSAAGAKPATLRAPAAPGDYEVRYVLSGAHVIARAKLIVAPVVATVEGPAGVKAGSDFKFSWSGPNHKTDQLQLVPSGMEDGRYNPDWTVRADAARPATLRAPEKPGAYELRYVLGGAAVIARRRIVINAQ